MFRIDSKKVFLIPFNETHLNNPLYLNWLSDYEVMKFIGRDEYLRPIRFEKIKEYVESVWSNPFCSFFAIHLIENNDFVGTAKLNFLNFEGLQSRTADVGIMIGEKRYWGIGLATDAIQSISDYAFNRLSARKLTSGMNSSNIGVIKAFEKVGYTIEGRLRKKLLVENRYHDHILMGCFYNELIK